MSQKVFLLAAHSAWGGASNFNDMFNSGGYECIEILSNTDPYDYGSHMNDKKLFQTNKEDLSLITAKLSVAHDAIFFLFDMGGVNMFYDFIRGPFGHLRDCRVNTFWSGTGYKEGGYAHYNKWRQNAKVRVSPGTSYAMPDLVALDPESQPLYQPQDLIRASGLRAKASDTGALKERELTIYHTPGRKGGDNRKGTLDIRRILGTEVSRVARNLIKSGIQVSYEQLGTSSREFAPHARALAAKAASHIFIDKVGSYSSGGLGKSGLESLAMGVPTVSSVYETQFRDPYKGLQDCIIDGTEPTQWVPEVIRLLEDKEHYDRWVENILLKNECIGFDNTLAYLEETMTR